MREFILQRFYFDVLARNGAALVALSGLLSLVPAYNYLRWGRLKVLEFILLVFFAVLGGFMMVSGRDVITIFIGLETMAVSAYALAGYNTSDLLSAEAAGKYFVMGATAGAFFIFGAGLFYGATGSLTVAGAVVTNQALAYLSAAFIFAGLCFKVSAFPMQWWVPDVYQGAPIPSTVFFATAVKAAAFVAFLRIFSGMLVPSGAALTQVISVIAVLTMSFGNLCAMFQDDLKRMLAYSSIAHAGYILLAFVVLPADAVLAVSAVSFYLLAYILMTAGAFVSLILVSGAREKTQASSLSGLGRRSPIMAFMFTLFMISLAGFPPTAGFLAKFYVLKALMSYNHWGLAAIAAANVLISIYYYMRPVVITYFGDPDESVAPMNNSNLSAIWIVLFCAVATILLGIFPKVILTLLGVA